MLAEIEDSIINAVKSASRDYRLAEVASYGGQYDEDLSQVVRSFPSVWVVFGGSAKPQKIARDKWKVPCTFVVLVGSRSVANEAATRKGDTAGSPGTYRMLEDVADLLVGQDLGLPIAELAPGAVKTLYSTRLNGQAISVFSQEFHTAYIQEGKIQRAAEESPVLETVGIDYHLTPDDGKADASDQVTLTD